MPSDWLKIFTPLCQPIERKTKTNHNLLARVFLHFSSATCMYLLRVLVHVGSLECLCPLSVVKVITLVLVLHIHVWHYSELKTALCKPSTNHYLFTLKACSNALDFVYHTTFDLYTLQSRVHLNTLYSAHYTRFNKSNRV